MPNLADKHAANESFYKSIIEKLGYDWLDHDRVIDIWNGTDTTIRLSAPATGAQLAEIERIIGTSVKVYVTLSLTESQIMAIYPLLAKKAVV